jgi:hypothetical protein
MKEYGGANIIEVRVPPDRVARAREAGSSVVVMPRDEHDGLAVYTEPSVLLVKQLRAFGIDADFLDPPNQRVFDVKKSNFAATALAFVIGIGSDAAWDSARLSFKRAGVPRDCL